ncbi:oligosaccharide flippase family protein [Methylobacterium sp. CLZ]|nr:oligosaccharide flippase family protein [Methylobacterium sp. CLZ]QIJ73326.1 oligosaccharide flippase family protein [Methylobacterium sp. CLZ]
MPLARAHATALSISRTFARSTTLVKNSSALAVGTVVSAALGFGYWWLAARMFPPEAIGRASAILSVMSLIGLLGEAGLGTLLTGEIVRHRDRTEGLVAAACTAGVSLSLLLGLIYLLLAPILGAPEQLIGNRLCLFAFLAGCALTGLCYVGDSALVGMLQSTRGMIRNILFAVFKLVFLVAALSAVDESTILLTWVAALLVSWIALDRLMPGLVRRFLTRPDFRLLSSLRGKALGHYWLDLTLQAPNLGMPYLVLVLLSPSINAAFATFWMVVLTMGVLPSALSTVLFPAVRAEPRQAMHYINLSLALSLAVSLVCALGVFLFSQTILSLFNPAYPEIAGAGLRFLGFSLIGLTLKMHACTLVRLSDSMMQASRWFALGLIAELSLSVVGARLGGLQGLVIGYTLAVTSVGAVGYACSVVVAKRRPGLLLADPSSAV